MSRSEETRPTVAIVWSLIAGLVILASALGGVHILGFSLFAPIVFELIGMMSGSTILLAGLLLWATPKRHETWGAVVLVFSASSLLKGGGMIAIGFPLGFVFGLFGGILAIQWRPLPMMTPATMP